MSAAHHRPIQYPSLSSASYVGHRFPEERLKLTICKAGFAGSASIACGGGVIADLFAERERASAMALYSLGPLMGAFYNV